MPKDPEAGPDSLEARAQWVLWGHLLARAVMCSHVAALPAVPVSRDGAGLRDGVGRGWQGDSLGRAGKTRSQKGGERK